MIAGKTVLAFVMAGGEGSRLHPLTAQRSKLSVPFNGRHRVVDFVLSNLVNSEIFSIYRLVHYKSQSLIEALTWAHSLSVHDFGKDVLPTMCATHHVRAYDFSTNRVPGLHDFKDPSYWRDVGSIDADYNANFDTLGDHPSFCMDNAQWPIFAHPDNTEAVQIHDAHRHSASLAAGVQIRRASLERSLLRRDVVVEEGARVSDSIIMDRTVVGPHAPIHRAIIDQNNCVPPGFFIGFDREAEQARFHVSEQGIVGGAKGQLKP